MKLFPSSLYEEQTLYSVVPLSLDINQYEYPQNFLSKSEGEYQFFLLEDFPNQTFNFFGKKYLVMQNTKDSSSPHAHTTPSPPFNVLMVGPTYTCRKLVHSFNSWERIAPIFPPYNVEQSNNNTRSSLSVPPLWQPIVQPYVWVQATFAHVEVTCSFPHTLKQELQRIFNFPITVEAVPPMHTEFHNEFTAWLITIYAIFVARNLYRTVLCHHSSWKHQYLVWEKNTHSIQKPHENIHINTTETISISKIQRKHTPCIEVVIEKSNIEKKKYIYRHMPNNILHRRIGMSNVSVPIMPSPKKETKSFALELSRKNRNLYISIPFMPSYHTQMALTSLASVLLHIPIERIHLQMLAINTLKTVNNNAYTILANLLIQACATLKANKDIKTEKIRSTLPVYRQYKKHAAGVIELDIERYSKKIYVRKVFLSFDLGIIADKKRIHGIIEYHIYDALFKLLGSSCLPENIADLIHISFITHHEAHYSASVSTLIMPTLRKAILDAYYDTTIQYFPIWNTPV